MSSEQILNELKATKFGLGLLSFTARPDPYPQSALNETLLATIKKNLPNKTFINGGEFYGPNDINVKYVKSFIDSYPEQRQHLIISIKGATDIATFTPHGTKEGIQKSIDNITSYIPDLDLFEAARLDPTVPVEVTIAAINDNVDSGKIKGISVSEVNANTLRKLAKISKHKIVCAELEFSIFSRDILTNGLAQAAGELDIPIIAYSPLSRGLLSCSIKSTSDLFENDFRKTFDRFTDENLKKNAPIIEFVEKAAAKKNITPAQYSLAWVRYWSEKTIDGIKFPKIIDIPSTSSVKRVEENFSDIVLTQEEFDEANNFLKGVTVHGLRYNAHAEKLLSQ
ncbi:unnamed protein product [Wickerhamomyces anomalus]